MPQFIERFTDGFDGSKTVENFGGVVPVNDAAGAVEPLDCDVRGVFDGGAEVGLAFAEARQ